MTCSHCQRDNPSDAAFCAGCGQKLGRICASCERHNDADASFCNGCGSPLASPSPRRAPAERSPADTRKVVTIVFADLVGSTALHERLEPESARRFMESYYVAMRGAVESHGGTVTQLLGDGVKAVFGIPRVAEDDAIRGVRAAAAMQDSFRALADEQRGAVGATGLRVAVNTGEVVASDEAEIIGDPVNVAARLQEQGRDGDVVVGESTHRLVSTLVTLELLGRFALKGRSEAVKAYRVVSLDRPAGAATAPFVGREDELARLGAVYETAVEKPAAGLAVVVGSPGLGKSRLIDEFARRAGEAATVVRAHCDAEGGATFAPLAVALRELLGIEGGATADTLHATVESALPGEEADRGRIATGIAALLAGSPASPEETFFVVRRLLGALARTRPVVLVIDDLHWAEPLLLDLVEHLIQWGSGVPLFVLIGARPELRDLRSSLVAPGGLISDVLTLSGLDAGAAMRLAANVIGAADLPAAIAAKVLATSEGNPLFVSELVRMLVQEGALTREGERWTAGANLAALEIPPTIYALLAARIERLQPEERTVLERAAVVGRSFSRGALAALLPHDAGDLDARLEGLRRSELIERDTGWLLGEPVLRFHHLLIRDAAYRRLLKGTRADLHRTLADWIEAQVGDAPEHDETIGWHLEQAHAFLGELGPLDASAKRLGERASLRLASAGRRALGGDDVPLAASLLGRALDRLDPDDPNRAELALDWCEALLAAGDVVAASAAIAELGRFCRSGAGAPETADTRRLRAWRTCFIGQHTVLTAPEALQETADTVAAAAESLATLGDAAGEAKAHFVYALALSRLGQIGACEAALDRALAAARRVAGDRRRANTVLAVAPLAALWGPSPVTRASGRCLDVVRVLRITQGAPAVEAVALSCQGVLEALRGRTEAARRMIASARKMVEELGITQRLLEVDVFGGLVELQEGDAVAAERTLRVAYDGLRELGLGVDAARAAALLARALLAQGRVDEAEALSHESEALAGDDLKAAIAWRGARAESLAHRGEHSAAVKFATQAVEIASATDALLDHADARLALAAALRASGRGPEADAEEQRAHELWEAKGATLLAGRARRDEAHTDSAPDPSGEDPTARRRVHPNSATTAHARISAATRAHHLSAMDAIFSDDYQAIDHPTGSTYGREAVYASMGRLFRSHDAYYQTEPLATLGESLMLYRRWSGASSTRSGHYDVGEYESEALHMIQVNEQGLVSREEIFAADRLGDAVNRLHECYAEGLPEGPERSRATRVAAAVATLLSPPPYDLEHLEAMLAADLEAIDHRHLSLWSVRGAESFVEHRRALAQVAEHISFVTQEILALEPDASLTRIMHSGTEREGGGDYERPFLLLLTHDAEGRPARIEWFDANRGADALARFEALTSPSEGGVVSPRRVRPNAASRNAERSYTALVAGSAPKPSLPRRVRTNAAQLAATRMGAAVAARDFVALAAVLGEPLEAIDHRWHVSYGRDGVLETCRRMMQPPDAEVRSEPIAALGDGSSLSHQFLHASAASSGQFDVGEHATEYFSITGVDRTGKIERLEFFGTDCLSDALVRLYEVHAAQLPEGPERERAAATARSVAVWSGPIDVDRMATALRPSVENIDHRNLGTWSARGAEEFLRHWREQLEITESWALRDEAVLATSANAFVVRRTYFGAGRDTGGTFENLVLSLWIFGADGLLDRIEVWEPDQEVEALARFDALEGGGETQAGPEPFENPAARADRRLFDCFNSRDWAGVEALAAPELVFDERRRMLHNTCGREIWLEQFRVLFDVPESHFRSRLLATRGERLSLNLHCFWGRVADGGGPLEMDDHLVLHEVDPEGRIVAIVLFDLEDEAAAHAELDARFEAGEGAAYPRVMGAMGPLVRAWHEHDWDALAAGCAPAFRYRDHRLLGFGAMLDDAAKFARSQRALIELAPDSRTRIDHVRISQYGALRRLTQLGTRDGGAFETPFISNVAVDEQGRILSIDSFDVERLDEAIEHFVALAGPAREASPFANAATRAFDQQVACFRGRDWARYADLLPAGFRYSDRRRVAQLELDAGQYVAFVRPLGEMASARLAVELLATRGERLALVRIGFEGADGDVGPSEIDDVSVIETDEHGRCIVRIRFDAEDLDVAYAELDARWQTGEATEHASEMAWIEEFSAAFARRDWDTVATCFTADFVGHDHRLVSWGTLHGAAEFLKSLQEMVALATDARMQINHRRISARAAIQDTLWVGSREGGAFESPFVSVSELDAKGGVRRIDFYDSHHLDRALTRFEALTAATPPDSPAARMHPNAANTAMDRWLAAYDTAFDSGDWEPVRATCAAEFAFHDHRRFAQLSGDRELLIAAARERVAMGARAHREQIGRAGQRIAIDRVLWAGGPADGPFEIEYLHVSEVDASGLLTRMVLFDLDDPRAAQREAWTRWAAIAPEAAAFTTPMGELIDAFNAQDRERWRATLADEIVVEDHRRTGFGRLEGADAYADSLTALWDLAPETRIEAGWHWLAHGPHGAIAQVRRTGVISDGGDLESDYLHLFTVSGDRITHIEFFEIDAADAALARFEELREGPDDRR